MTLIEMNSFNISVDLASYSLLALQNVIYWMSGKHTIRISSSTNHTAKLEVTSTQDKNKFEEEFWRRLIDQELREKIKKETQPIRDLIIAQAFSHLNLVNSDIDEGNPFDDPLNAAPGHVIGPYSLKHE